MPTKMKLFTKEIDVAAVGLAVNPSRSTAIDFTAPFLLEQYGVIIRKPDPVKNLWNVLSVYSLPVWGLILLSALLATVILRVIHKAFFNGFTSGYDNISTVAWYIWSSLVNQGMYKLSLKDTLLSN